MPRFFVAKIFAGNFNLNVNKAAMKKFIYKGYDAQSMLQHGTLEAEDYAAAYAALLYQGVTVVSLRQEKLSVKNFILGHITRLQLGERWVSTFFRELSVMLGTMTLHSALELLTETSRGHVSEKVLRDLANAVGGGEKFSAALRRHEVIFSGDIIQSIEIAEESGKTQDVTKTLSARLERSYVTGRKVRGAMYYPVVVFIAAIIAAVIMINVTLPVFESFYQDRGGDLPLTTFVLLHGGKFVTEHLILIATIFLAVIFSALMIYREVDAVKFFVDKMKLNVKILREIALRNLFGRLSFLLESGVTLDEAIRLTALSNENAFMQHVLSDAKLAIEKGDTLEKVLRRGIKKISPLYLGLIATGEATGEIVEMLRQCESMADFEIEETLRELPAKAEVCGTLAAGFIVAILVFSIMLPIFNMSSLNF